MKPHFDRGAVTPTPNNSISLAAIEPNQVVKIEKLLFASLERLCADLGLREGDLVRCRASSTRRLYLSTVDARTVAIDRDQARFVQVVPRTQPNASAEQRHLILP
ncbi:MAG: hypothetical protein WEE89_13080 [Gemmatimonadota bacterium]